MAINANSENLSSTSDPLVDLARQTVEHFVLTGQRLTKPKTLDPQLMNQQAGVFVSLHKGDDLRGCIGTIEATKPTIADEIISNGVLACSQDPRFYPVEPEELDFISYSVDVLGKAEEIDSLNALDVKRYGVIVSRGNRRGLLLPDLEGVDSVEQQVAIARQKAGLYPDEPVTLERFEVIRHQDGGEARR